MTASPLTKSCKCGGIVGAWLEDEKPVLHERGAWACVHYVPLKDRAALAVAPRGGLTR